MRLVKFISILIMSHSLTVEGISQDLRLSDQYLRSALYDQSLEKFSAQLDFLEDNNYNSPWLNRVELRIGSEDANASLNEYRVRLSPTNPAEIKANKLYYRRHQESLKTQHEVALNRALKNRYSLLIRASYYQSILSSLDSQLEILNGLSQSALRDLQNLDLTDLVDIQSDETELLLQKEENTYRKEQIEYLMALDFPEVVNIDWENLNWKSVQQIKNFIDGHESLQLQNNLSVLEAEQDFSLRQQRLKIEKAEARSNIGYIQANLDTERGNELSEHVGFQVGVRLPIVNPDKPELNRDRVDLIERQKELDETKVVVQQKKDLLLMELEFLITQYSIIQSRIQLADQVKIGNSGVKISDVGKLSSYKYELVYEKFSKEREIREVFIDYLDLQGLIVQRPLINHLSSEMRTIEAD